jgi:hypothetical protein
MKVAGKQLLEYRSDRKIVDEVRVKIGMDERVTTGGNGCSIFTLNGAPSHA